MSSADSFASKKEANGAAVEAQLVPEAAEHQALGLLAGAEGVVVDEDFLSSPEARRVKRKIDLHILPFLIITVLLQNLDKATLAYGAIMGIRKDLRLEGNQYALCSTLVYVGFIAWEIPAHMILQRVNIARYASITVILWGATVCCHAAVSSFGGLAACRFILGMMECGVTPAFVLITGNWYTQREQINRVALWFGTASLSQILGGLLAYGCYHMPSFRWQGLFVIFGGLTIIHGICMSLFFCSNPSSANFLTAEEKVIALERVRFGKAGAESWGFNKAQLIEALKDVRLYLFFLVMVCTGLPNGGVGAFGPTIIASFGYTASQTTLLSMAPGVSEGVGIVAAMYMARKTGSRCWTGVTMIAVAVVGIIMMLAIPPSHYHARFAGYCLLYWWPIVVIFIISFLTSCVSGHTKKLAFNCAYNIGYCLGNLLGPQTYQAYMAPQYYVAKFIMLGFIVCSALVVIAIWATHKIWNAQRDRQDAEDLKNGIVHQKAANSEFLDLTDNQQRDFRYPL